MHFEARELQHLLTFLPCFTVQCMVTGDWSALDDVCQQPVHCSLLSSLSPAWHCYPDIDTLSIPLSLRSPSRDNPLSLSVPTFVNSLCRRQLILVLVAPFRPTRINAAAVSTSKLLSPTCVHPLLSTSDSPVSSQITIKSCGQSTVLKWQSFNQLRADSGHQVLWS